MGLVFGNVTDFSELYLQTSDTRYKSNCLLITSCKDLIPSNSRSALHKISLFQKLNYYNHNSMGSSISELFSDIVVDDLKTSCAYVLLTQYFLQMCWWHNHVHTEDKNWWDDKCS